MKSDDALLSWLTAIPISLVYTRFLAHAEKVQTGLNIASRSIPGAGANSFSFPIPNEEEFARMWEQIASNEFLSHFWQKRLRLSDLNPVFPLAGKSKAGGFVDARDEAA
jgi:hypothetical protein